jgi:hypothetical protein
MTLITETSDPTLHTKLKTAFEAQRQPGWIMDGYKHYRVVYEDTNKLAFELVGNRAMYDSRSVIGSRPATYTKLDQ